MDQTKVNKSNEKMADLLSVEVVDKLSDDKDQASIHEGFEPQLVV
jgi:hypothetical protein